MSEPVGPMRVTWVGRLGPVALVAMGLAWPGIAAAWEMSGTKQVGLRTKDGRTVPIGTVTFTPQDQGRAFALKLDLKDFQDFFLSMREFKCLEGPELQCYVPYPYANPKTVGADDLSWLEHSLIFFYKTPADYGAKLANGLIYSLKRTEGGLVGTPQSVDLNEIAAPPTDQTTAPLGPDARREVVPGSRWIESLIIE